MSVPELNGLAVWQMVSRSSLVMESVVAFVHRTPHRTKHVSQSCQSASCSESVFVVLCVHLFVHNTHTQKNLSTHHVSPLCSDSVLLLFDATTTWTPSPETLARIRPTPCAPRHEDGQFGPLAARHPATTQVAEWISLGR